MKILWRSLKRLIPQRPIKRWLYGGIILLGVLLVGLTSGWSLLLSAAACLVRVVEVKRTAKPIKSENFPVWESHGYFFEGDGH